jgi:hypothetical protein
VRLQATFYPNERALMLLILLAAEEGRGKRNDVSFAPID